MISVGSQDLVWQRYTMLAEQQRPHSGTFDLVVVLPQLFSSDEMQVIRSVFDDVMCRSTNEIIVNPLAGRRLR